MPRLWDTAPDAEPVLMDLYRRMTPGDKLRRVADLNGMASAFAAAGLRARHPGAEERELFLRLAALRLGAAVVARAYGRALDTSRVA